MIEIPKKKRSALTKLFEASTDSTIFSVLEGTMGKAFADCENDPNYALLYLGDFLFLSNQVGKFDIGDAATMLEEFAQIRELKDVFMVPQTKEWNNDLKGQYREIKRYRFKEMRPEDINAEMLKERVAKLPKGFYIKKFDEALCKQALSKDWAKDFCVNFKEVENFLTHGIGIGILQNEQLVCGASAYSYYSKGIEVEIATNPEFRRMGLATVCGAALLLEGKKQGKRIHWDAANQMSATIAKKLGYEYQGEYSCYQKE